MSRNGIGYCAQPSLIVNDPYFLIVDENKYYAGKLCVTTPVCVCMCVCAYVHARMCMCVFCVSLLISPIEQRTSHFKSYRAEKAEERGRERVWKGKVAPKNKCIFKYIPSDVSQGGKSKGLSQWTAYIQPHKHYNALEHNMKMYRIFFLFVCCVFVVVIVSLHPRTYLLLLMDCFMNWNCSEVFHNKFVRQFGTKQEK